MTPIDLATNTPGAPITVGSTPFGIAITPDGKTAYVTNAGDNTVTPIDVATNTAGAAIHVGSRSFGTPVAVAITPDGKTAYVTNYGDNTVTPISVATNAPGTPIPVPGSFPTQGVFGIAITPDGKTAYVANWRGANSVTPIDLATNTPGAPITVGSTPFGIAITPDGKSAYVTSQEGNGTVTPIDLATNTPGTAIPVGGFPQGITIAITPVVADRTPPVLVLPANIEAIATGPAGTTVTYTATATDAVDGPVPATCTPPSGSTFAIGTTTVSAARPTKRATRLLAASPFMSRVPPNNSPTSTRPYRVSALAGPRQHDRRLAGSPGNQPRAGSLLDPEGVHQPGESSIRQEHPSRHGDRTDRRRHPNPSCARLATNERHEPGPA